MAYAVFSAFLSLNRVVHAAGLLPFATATPAAVEGKPPTTTLFPVPFPLPPIACWLLPQAAVTVVLFAAVLTTVTVAVPLGPLRPVSPLGPCGPCGPGAPVSP